MSGARTSNEHLSEFNQPRKPEPGNTVKSKLTNPIALFMRINITMRTREYYIKIILKAGI